VLKFTEKFAIVVVDNIAVLTNGVIFKCHKIENGGCLLKTQDNAK